MRNRFGPHHLEWNWAGPARRWFLDMRASMLFGLIFVALGAACGGDARTPIVAPTTTQPPTTVTFALPPADLTTVPPLVITIPPVSGDGSQSPEDAVRDGVVAALADLPLDLRVAQVPEDFGITRIESSEGIWLISSPSRDIPGLVRGCLLGNSNGTLGRDVICVSEYDEILLLDPATGAIIKAYPFSSIGPQALAITDDAIYCIRQGDGGLPDSMLCRIERDTLDATVRVFPWEEGSVFGPDSDHHVLPNWIIDDPTSLVLWQRLDTANELVRIEGLSGSAKVDPVSLELVEVIEQ